MLQIEDLSQKPVLPLDRLFYSVKYNINLVISRKDVFLAILLDFYRNLANWVKSNKYLDIGSKSLISHNLTDGPHLRWGCSYLG